MSSLSYHETNLLLIAREIMRLLVNHQLIPMPLQPRRTFVEQICYKRSQGNAISSLHCLLFLTPKKKKKKKKKNLKRISKSATNVVLSLKFLWVSKFVFP